MKTTLDLPDELVRRMKLKAIRDGRKLKEVAAEMIRAGLDASAKSHVRQRPVVLKDKKTGLPVIQCRRAAPPGQEMTPERVAETLESQEAGWVNDPG